MDLKTLEDYQKAARSWVEHVIPSDATFIKKLCCISTQSLNVFRDLLWLTRKEPLKPDFDEGYLACPVDLWRPVLNEYYPHDLWLYSVLRAVKILSFWKPIFDNAGSDLESSYQDDPGLYKIWPKMSDATTAFNGAGFSTAEAIINGLWGFLLNTVECFCSRDRDMPDIFLVSENVMGYRNDQKNMEIWPNQHPAIKLWKDATLKEAKEYFPLAKWPLADLDGEYSRVSILLDNEVKQAEKKQSLDSPDVSETPKCEHSVDFTSVIWYGKKYNFTKTQAECVKCLWKEWEKGGLSLSEKTIGELIASVSENYRLVHTFDRGKHPAWGKMIISVGKGIFALRKP